MRRSALPFLPALLAPVRTGHGGWKTPSVRIIDRIADPAAEPDFSFDGDAPLLR